MSPPPEPPRTSTTFDEYSDDYAQALQRGLAVSGEDRDFFAERRVAHVRFMLAARTIRRVLDFGCGDGATCRLLAAAFPGAEVVGTDISMRSVERARARNSSSSVRFLSAQELPGLSRSPADLVYSNGVFHHIEPGERRATVATILGILAPEGVLALWENNPWNPGTRIVMRRIPFDRDAVPLSSRVASHLLRGSGLRIDRMDFLFYFPRALAFLRRTEPFLRRLPLGAQYCAFCTRPSGPSVAASATSGG